MAGSRKVDASCAEIMRVLADPTRYDVVQLLIEGARYVHEINAALRTEPTLLSHHLKVLRDAGLVETARAGKAVLYRLSPAVARQADTRTLEFGCCKLEFNEPQKKQGR